MKAIQNTASDLIYRVISQNIDPIGIYCFAQKKSSYTFNEPFQKSVQKEKHVHLYLLIIAEEFEDNIGNDITDKIKSRSRGQITVTILLHRVRNIIKLYGDQQYFFWNVFKNAQRIHIDAYRSPIIWAKNPEKRYVKSTSAYAGDRRNVTASIWDLIYNNDQYFSYEVRMCSLHQIVEQICLSLIRVFLGYTPNHFSLGYLFELCEYFTSLTSEHFPRNSRDEKNMFKLLKKNPNTLRFSRRNSFDYLYYGLMEDRCRDFMKEAEVLIQKELERLEGIHLEEALSA
ncbi:hypothetical protein [Flavobacterium gelatinilyticum]|uniref:hypothetical protein n=1 Tax=Flavobacterium gelatinilyticum TaxID=3003260 RepID=UPI0024816476|nr:hypothetical protein [Flavobacterium gelatinilyticum]